MNIQSRMENGRGSISHGIWTWLAVYALIAFTYSAQAAFVHPGLLHTESDFTRMRDKVNSNAQPWKGSWDLLVASRNSQSTWASRPTATVIRGGAGDNCAQLYNDVHAAYQNALRWKISGNVAHANKAIEIMNAWSATLTSIGGNADRFLAAGIYGYQFANAAEIMRTYSGWAPADFARFKTMMVNVFYPMNHDFLVNHNTACITNYWANWDLCNMASVLAIGILCDDQAKVDEAINYFKNGGGNGAINKAVPILHSATLGQWQEAGRDQEHSLMGVGLMAAFCEMAWNQGLDMYGWNNNRFMAGAEYVARYNLFKPVPFSYYSWGSGTNCAKNTQSVISNAGQGATRPIWDLVYNHYANRRGITVPEIGEKAAQTRPDGGPQYGAHGSAFDQLGFTSLTFMRDPIPTSVPYGTYQVDARHSAKSLTVFNSGTANGSNVEQRTYVGGSNQHWTIAPLGNNQYHIINLRSGKFMDVNGSSTANGANIHTWDYTGGNNQKFTLTPTTAGYYRFTPVHSGKSTDVQGVSSADGANVHQWDYLGGENQQWKLTAVSTVRRLASNTAANLYVRHAGFRGRMDTDPWPAQDSEFRLVLGLSGSTGVSFESINFPGYYLRVRANGEVWVEANDNTAAFRDSATFRRVGGLADTAKSSFQMWTDATRYLRHSSFLLYAQTISGTTAQADATFAEMTAP